MSDVKKAVREGYARIAEGKGACCAPRSTSREVGYTDEDVAAVPEGTVTLGCGNPVALASLKAGETVLDLGSGAGFDCFLAAKRVGKLGRVIGVDMTPEMVARAKQSAERGGYANVEFRLGEIEHLPVADNSVDAVLSNCVINLVLDKRKAFAEAFRVLKPGGRLMVSDIVLLAELPESVRKSVAAYVGCLSGAVQKEEYIKSIKAAGFKNVAIAGETRFPAELILNDPTAKAILGKLGLPAREMAKLAGVIASIKVSGEKPSG
jgi:SAM-dependent methyltransferase